MGCTMCIPAALDMPAEKFYGSPTLPPGIVRVDEGSDPELREEFVRCLTESFAGTAKTAPEPLTTYGFEEAEPPLMDHAKPAEPSKERMEFARFNALFAIECAARHGGCYALLDEDSSGKKVNACAATFPPNDKNLAETGACEIMAIVGKHPFPKCYEGGNSGAKLDKLMKLQTESHKAAYNGQHIYIFMMGTDPTCQGKGHGSKLMTFLADAADFHQVPIVLEAAGTASESFYAKKGSFEIVKRVPFETEGLKNGDGEKVVGKFIVDGKEGFAEMMRKPVPKKTGDTIIS